MLPGELVTVLIPFPAGEDGNGDPAVEWAPVEVDGALVYEPSGSDLSDADRPEGRRVMARIQLPDGAMSAFGRDGLKGARIALTGRGQQAEDALWVIGSPNHAPGLPTGWDTTIEAGRVDG